MATYTIHPKTRALPRAEFIVAFWQKGALPFSAADQRRVQRQLQRVSARGDAHETHVVSLPAGNVARTLFLVGLGEKPTLDIFRRGVAAAVQRAKEMAIREIAVLVPEVLKSGEAIGTACVEGAELGGYAFTKYQEELAKKERVRSLRRVDVVVDRAKVGAVRRGLEVGKLFTEATIVARDLVNEPASHATPRALAEEARRIARASKGRVTVKILDRAACERRGMGAFLAVAQGSTHPPVFIHLTYLPGMRNKKRGKGVVALVGKGITFDSGGLSLKPAQSMETMKIDMAGAATVFGVFSALPRLQLPLTVHGFVAACENMPSGSATKPGDVVRSMSGKTIEIRNTDAEGRLTLADALTAAREAKPSVIVDLATLTGACVVALGEEVAGIFSNDGQMSERVAAAAHRAGEPVWELPIIREYRDQLKSAIADLKNISSKRWADAILAALFLKEFVGDTPWVHVDIAGPSYAEQQTNPVVPVGGSGFGVRTLLRFLQKFSTSSPHDSAKK